MCGRYALYESPEVIKSHFGVSDLGVLKPRYNIAPSLAVPVVIKGQWQYAHWGFVPEWLQARGEKTGPINARLETITDKPMFKGAFKTARCLVPLSGYFEWQQGDVKQPYFFRMPNDLAAMAGIYCQSSKGFHVAVLTKNASEKYQQIHDRMPVLLSPSDYQPFLSGKIDLINLPEMDGVVVYPVSRAVGDPRKDHFDLIKPLT